MQVVAVVPCFVVGGKPRQHAGCCWASKLCASRRTPPAPQGTTDPTVGGHTQAVEKLADCLSSKSAAHISSYVNLDIRRSWRCRQVSS